MRADLLVLIAIFAAGSQQPSPAPETTVATASIAGTIVTDEQNSRPIGRAVVTLRGAGLRPNLVVIADAAGRFAFSGLPAGNVMLTASKAPYLTMSYGQTAPGQGSGVPIALEAGQQVQDLTLRLPRGAVISGRILDPRGQPLRHAPITVLEYRTVNGKRTLWSLGGAWPPTDSAGAYRAYGLPPGSYIVSAYPPGDYLNVPGGSAGPFTPGGGAATGPELRELSAAEMEWATQQLRAADRSGNRAGTVERAGTVPPPGPTLAYAPVYYPGTPDPTDATPVAVERGEERSGIDFAMQWRPTALVAGRVIGPDGQPATNVRLSFATPGGGTTGWSSPDGTFSLTNLLSGTYTITAQAAGSTVSTSSEVAVNGRNVTGLVLSLQPRTTITGRVVFDASVLRPPSDLTSLRITFGLVQGGTFTLPTPVRADGTFETSLVVSAPYRLTASVSNPSSVPGNDAAWTLKSAIVNGRDVADVPFVIEPNQIVSDVVVTLTDRTSILSGRLLDASGRPAPGCYAVVFAVDAAFRTPGTRRFPAPARSATDGRFSFTGLPPGKYFVTALADVDPSSWSDAAFVGRISASATTITLGDGEKKVLELKVARVE